MKKLTVAVFGHYDSRGGTMAIEMPELTEAALKQAQRDYDRQFGIEEPDDPIEATIYGMPARVADQAVHALLYQDTTPGLADFLYVAELHVPDYAADIEGELSSGELESDVLIDGSDVRDGTWKWEDGPVQLELVPTDGLDFTDIDAREEADVTATEAAMDAVHPEGVGHHYARGFSSRDPQAVTDIRRGFNARHEEREAEKHRLITARAQALKDPHVTRWDDDAFGFVLIRSEA